MTVSKSQILSRLGREHDPELMGLLRSFLASSETRPVGSEPLRVNVADTLKLWETRLRNTDVTGRPIHGVRSFIKTMRNFAPNQELDQYGFVGPDMAGNVFFGAGNGDFVGVVLAERPVSTARH